MANVLKHRFASGKTDGPDATQVQPSHWNDGHIFSGGNAGDVLTRDPTDATYGAKFAPIPAAPAIGVRVDVPFNAGFYASEAGTWALAAGNQTVYSYTILGKLMIVNLFLSATALTGAPTQAFRVYLPTGVIARDAGAAMPFYNGVEGTGTGYISAVPGQSYLRLMKDLLGSVNWPIGTNFYHVVNVAFFIQ